MATRSRPHSSPQLQSLAQELKEWRASRNPGQRIPEELWKAAVKMARVHGLSRSATALKLSYYDLQRRLSGRAQLRRPGAAAASFVEVAPTALAGRVESGALELVKSSGARLTLRLPSTHPSDYLALVHLFLRQRP